ARENGSSMSGPRVATGALVDDCRITEADMDGCRSRDAIECAVERREPIVLRFLRTSLHVGFVDLYDVRTGCEKVPDLLIDGHSVVHGRFSRAGVKVVLNLLTHGERAGHRHFHLPAGVRGP